MMAKIKITDKSDNPLVDNIEASTVNNILHRYFPCKKNLEKSWKENLKLQLFFFLPLVHLKV